MIYGLNLWHGTPENAAAEAAYVFETLGPRLICFQIGNEPDMDHDAGLEGPLDIRALLGEVAAVCDGSEAGCSRCAVRRA